MLNLFKLKTKKINPRKYETIEKQKYYFKYFPVSTREWNNSIYVFNKYTLSLIPQSTISTIELIKSYLNIYNFNIERKMRKARFLKRLRKLSSNRVYGSNAELKHTNNKAIISLYTYNRQKYNYLSILKKRYLNIYFNKKLRKNLKKRFYLIKYTGLKYLKKTNNAKYNLIKYLYYLKKLKNKNINKIFYIDYYLIKFYKKWVKKSLKITKLYLYLKQLLYINESKYNYSYLQILQNHIQEIYNKNVEFNLINIKYHYFNSDILSESITLKITKDRRKLLIHLRNLIKKIKIYKTDKNVYYEPNINNFNLINDLNDPIENLLSDKIIPNYKSLKKIVLKDIKYKRLSGMRLKASGRLSKRYTASRSVTKLRYKGNLINIDSSYKGLSTIMLKNNLKSNLQFSKLKSKTRIGSFGIKGWVSGS